MIQEPSRLQHDTAKLLATIMRLTLPSREDLLQVCALLVSAAVSDDEPENLQEFCARVERSCHSVVLDMYGNIDPDSAIYKAREAGLLDEYGWRKKEN
jgi:hypothetical protein